MDNSINAPANVKNFVGGLNDTEKLYLKCKM